MKNRYKLIVTFIGMVIAVAAWANTISLNVSINGLTGKADTNAKAAIQNAQSNLSKPLTLSSINHFYREGPEVIRKAIQPYGYFKSSIKSFITRTNGQRTITYAVVPGPRLTISQFNVKITGDGKYDHRFQKYLSHIHFKPGEPLNTEKYTKIKQALFAIASNRGYFQANMKKSKIYINLAKYQGKIAIVFDTGPRFRFGTTSFNKTPFNIHFLRKFLSYREYEFYTKNQVQKTQKNLVSSGYFLEATVKPLVGKAQNGKVPININLIPMPSKQYIFGLGYGTDTGIRGTIGIKLNRVNSYGHRFETLLQASKLNSSLIAKYLIPWPNPTKNLLTFAGGIGNIDQESGTANSAKVWASYLTKFNSWQQIISLTYLDENYDLKDLPRTNAQLLYPSITWQFMKSDNQLNPSRGISLIIGLAGAPGSFTRSKSSFAQFRADGKILFTLFKRTRILVRSSFGRTEIQNLNNLPLSLQLFAGGAESIRGYSYNSIGPGKNLFVGSFELQEKVFGNWYVAGFIDGGNVTNGNPFANLKLGAGPALVYLSPIGSLELSLAKSFNQPTPRWRVQFSVGAEL